VSGEDEMRKGKKEEQVKLEKPRMKTRQIHREIYMETGRGRRK